MWDAAGPSGPVHTGTRTRTGGAWWRAAAADPELTDLFQQREKSRSSSGDGNRHLSVGRHTQLLHQAGFLHVTPVWQVGDSCVLVAQKG
jgi:hypothetical protein